MIKIKTLNDLKKLIRSLCDAKKEKKILISVVFAD